MIDVAVIGAGPAGIATALQLKLYDINCVLYEQDDVGGLLRNANLVENYLGFPQGIVGPDLIKLFKLQLSRLGVTVSSQRINMIDLNNNGFELDTDHGKVDCKHVVLASGTIPKKFTINNINHESCEKILPEIYSILDQQNLHISIIGAGDAAFDYAINLAKKNMVRIHNRSKRTRCLSHLFESAINNINISYYEDSNLIDVSIHRDNLQIEWNNFGVREFEEADYLIIAIGREPNISCLSTDVYKQMSELEKQGKLLMVGDVTNGINRQTGISVGDGIAAAMRLNKIIKE
jgi:thioredoxin reductase (NADPH)